MSPAQRQSLIASFSLIIQSNDFRSNGSRRQLHSYFDYGLHHRT
jgi:hypothetical protein